MSPRGGRPYPGWFEVFFFFRGRRRRRGRGDAWSTKERISPSLLLVLLLFLSFLFLSLSSPPRCSFDSPNVRVYPCPHRPVARRGGLVAPRLQRRELPQQQRVRFAKGVAAAVAGAAAAAVGGVDVLLVPVEAIRLNDRGRVAGWDKRERRQRERGSKSSWDGRKEGNNNKKGFDRRGRLFLSSSASSSLSSSSLSSSSLCLFSLSVDDVDAVEDLVYAHLVESLSVTPMSSSARAGERQREHKTK